MRMRVVVLGLIVAGACLFTGSQSFAARPTLPDLSTYNPGNPFGEPPGQFRCDTVRTKDGRVISLAVRFTSDTSARVATVEYRARTAYAPESVWRTFATGRASVVSVTMIGRGAPYPPPSWTRPGPAGANVDTCSSGGFYGRALASVVHLGPVELPTLAQVQAWCAEDGTLEGDCPVHIARDAVVPPG